jgi:hypothetical protein
MIYEFPDADAPIRQGDIFYPLPETRFDLDELSTSLGNNQYGLRTWEDVLPEQEVVITFGKVWAIVGSQDCDTARSPTITLFVILPIEEVNRNVPTGIPGWVSLISERSQERSKWFYLPQDNRIGFDQRMAVHFPRVITVLRENLEVRRTTHRKGRLQEHADEHFRESIAQFFRRYPYNEWYPMNAEEFARYRATRSADARPYDGQEQGDLGEVDEGAEEV